jgi:hypothetical protein
MPESDALRIHLLGSVTTTVGGYRYLSGFTAILRDAREDSGRCPDSGIVKKEERTGHWLGSVGYMILLDQVGKCFKPRVAQAVVAGSAIEKCLTYWTPELSEREIGALYGLRNGLAHDYSLFNQNPKRLAVQHLYRLDRARGQGVVRFGKSQWDGDYLNVNLDCETHVSLYEFGELVEEVARRVQTSAKNSELEVVLSGGSDELLQRYGILTPA